MSHQEQYYSAKIFLKHYNQALNTLEQCSKYEGLQRQYLQAKEGRSERSTQANEFTNFVLTRYLPNLRSADDFPSLEKEITRGLNHLRRDVKL